MADSIATRPRLLDHNGRVIPAHAMRPRPVARMVDHRGSAPKAFVPYEAASVSRERYGWNPTLGSADAMLLPHLALMRARSRDASRNGLGAGLIRTLVDYTVGKRGLVRQSRLDPELFGGDEERARQAERHLEAALRRRHRRVDLGGRLSWAAHQRLTCRAWLVDGEALVNLVQARGQILLELADADRLVTPPREGADGSVREGVHIDADGAPIGYWFTTQHPGDLFSKKLDYRYVPRWNSAGRPNVLHVYEALRTAQHRGEPALAPILARLDDNNEFVTFKLFQARGDAMQSYWIERGEASYPDAADGDETDDGTPIEEVESGGIRYLRDGEKVVVPETSRPGSETQVFRDTIHSEIAAALGLTLELVAKDFTKTTWHSARQSSLEVMRTVGTMQDLMIDQAVCPIDDIWCEDAILAGEVEEIPPALYWSDPEGFLACHYQVPVRGLVDPGQENKASETALKLGLTTRADECAVRGRDWQEVDDQQAREQAYRKAKGIVAVEEPKRTGAQEKTAPEDTEEPDDDTDDTEEKQDDQEGDEE